MTAFRPPSPELVARVRQESERALSAEEFQAWVARRGPRRIARRPWPSSTGSDAAIRRPPFASPPDARRTGEQGS